MEQYIAEKKILGVVVLEEEKTPSGNEMVEVKFENGTTEKMPKMRFEMIKSDKISDASTVQKTIQTKIGAQIYGLLNEFGVLFGEAEEILNSASTYVNSGYTKARDILWGCEHQYLSLIEINKILIKNHEEQNNNGAVAPGSGSDTKN